MTIDGSNPSPRYCAVIPTYDNPQTIQAVVATCREHLDTIIVVDDGSHDPGRAACQALADQGQAHVVHRERNGGKGAAVKTGFETAQELGFTHVVQVDADGQHDLSRISAFIETSRATPEALILGYPKYDASVPKGRLAAREITKFWVNLEVGRGVILDAMVGFRVYPLAALQRIRVGGDRMDFDIEVAVRLAWAGVPILNREVGVRYLAAEDGGVSHFQPVWDNVRFSWLHTRLCTRRWLETLFGVRQPPRPQLPA